jgi:hypothetical protein
MEAGDVAPVEVPDAVFTIFPPRCEIPAKGSVDFTFSGLATLPGLVEERLQCSTGSGASRHVIFDVQAR